MNKILLINRTEPQDDSEEKKKIFFTIGEMNSLAVENKIVDILHREGITGVNDIILKYNGIEINITVQQIPNIVKLLCKENISIYGIYQLYNPDL